jgi:serine/threonine protein kinase/tetratricopeptide (TPR) repeat protein
MTQQNLEQSIFLHAIGLASPVDRAVYLDQACRHSPELRAEVDALLAAHGRLGGAAPCPIHLEPTRAALAPPAEDAGAAIGPYKLLEQIGEGGMGVVWMAEQKEPIHRRVALKVIKAGMDSKQVLARFEAERQALALMDHPHIARVLDAGVTGTGRPYFVMELVKGAPITQYCDDKHLSLRERLELFGDVCRAVQHAHQKGIIHRDLKPSNILIAPFDGKPVVKVIDFGVAKATGQRLTDATLFTGFGAVVGTPEYMSPEQAETNNQDIDTRSDIYSLGVLLYELLTGSTPLTKKRVKEAALLEVLRVIREEDPPKPSTRLSSTEELPSISAQRHTEPAKLAKLVRGELDWIVMKALEKDRGRRYETASDFAQDLQCYLDDEPVRACPPSAWYRCRKFVRRNNQTVWTASLIVLALVAAVVGTTWSLIREQRHSQALQAAHQRERLLNERARQAIETVTSDQAIDQLTREKLRPEQEDFLAKMIQYYAESAQEAAATKEEGARQARAYHRMGRLNNVLGRSQDSENAYRRAVALGQQLTADFPTRPEFRQELAYSHNALGNLLRPTRPREAEAAYREALAILKQLAADFLDRPEFRQALAGVYNNLGNVFQVTGRPTEAEDAYVEALAIRKQLAADFPSLRNIRRALAMSHNCLGWLFQTTERLPESEAAYRDAVALQRQHFAENPNEPEFRLELAKYLFNLGNVLRDTGRTEDGEAAHAEAIVIFKQLVAEFPNRPEFRQELAERELNLGAAHHNRAGTYAALGQWAKAAADFQRARELNPENDEVWLLAAYAYLAAGDAANYRRTCRELVDRVGQTDDPVIAERTAKVCSLASGAVADFGVVERLAEFAVTAEQHDYYPFFVLAKGLTENRAGCHAEAAAWLERFAPQPDRGWNFDAIAFAALAMAQHRLGRTDEAKDSLAKAKAIVAEKMPDPSQGRRFEGNWHDWLHAQMLSCEAEEMLKNDADLQQHDLKKTN